ncbi:TIGR04282 family arsenosugar biosynthesis glycosyltransferase [Ferrovum sp. PN-J185]|uniref:TIGR04282 family arsenosugar biosynthesis glycosyltransferase n=1 Tax=Ferrovum sp. PN-J185 TaxID=1356306 RepID=UPI0007957E15|nr:TIGR04282 family arsenosugar biosynthesis glycosyltransferase [Ferrovum sp. PN-J185]KXW56950.1 2-phospho-L-lactate guanylyltransferase [Ferrovum sp. PN-J185]MCC6069176.1 TIGR04282 family arsenosugar biosynthesis glycosyltransferase [Ferrovum sp. PN-J185]MDE1892361.1 TIGR04282 family arsenosugar biosynthesis glycosyltransferase [Betaproteobacteria bacterium]
MKNKLIMFAKAPIRGFAKTRLIPHLGLDNTAYLAKNLILHNLNTLNSCDFIDSVELIVTSNNLFFDWSELINNPKVRITQQCDGSLGDRLIHAAQQFYDNNTKLLIIGTDCIEIDKHILLDAFNTLDNFDTVICPAYDGGFTLLGLKKFDPHIFKNIMWSTEKVANQTMDNILELGYSLKQLKTLHDIDDISDLVRIPSSFYIKE